MKMAVGVLLLLDSAAVPFSRIWCDYELFTTVSDPDKTLDIATKRGKARLLTEAVLPGETLLQKTDRESKFPVSLLSKGLNTQLQEGKASVEKDKENILKTMGRNSTGVFDDDVLTQNLQQANSIIRSYFALAAWPRQLRRGIDPRLPEALSQDTYRTSVELCLSGRNATDDDVQRIASALPPRLASLRLSFDNSTRLSDTGLAGLAQQIVRLPLNQLHLDCLGCPLVTDVGISVLASNLPDGLREIRLEFGLCPNIGNEGVKILAAGIPQTVSKLRMSFRGTKCNKTFNSVAELQRAFKSQSGLLLAKKRSDRNL